jgi:putative PIN family toxin of toxin-antitoxin system
MDIVLDTNVVVSAAINPNGTPAAIAAAWQERSFIWIVSEPLLVELDRTLHSQRLRSLIKWNRDQIAEFMEEAREFARIIAPVNLIDVIKDDPDDNRVRKAAVEGAVDYIVSGDRDLLGLGEYANIPIITPARFVAVLRTGLG